MDNKLKGRIRKGIDGAILGGLVCILTAPHFGGKEIANFLYHHYDTKIGVNFYKNARARRRGEKPIEKRKLECKKLVDNNGRIRYIHGDHEFISRVEEALNDLKNNYPEEYAIAMNFDTIRQSNISSSKYSVGIHDVNRVYKGRELRELEALLIHLGTERKIYLNFPEDYGDVYFTPLESYSRILFFTTNFHISLMDAITSPNDLDIAFERGYGGEGSVRRKKFLDNIKTKG